MRAWRFQEASKRLKLSYDMDPSNLLCYGSYFLFLSESVSRLHGVEGENAIVESGRQQALELALDTVRACKDRTDEPTAMITGSSAAHDAITILVGHGDKGDGRLAGLHHEFGLMLDRYLQLRAELVGDGRWEGYSIYRRKEMDEGLSYLRLAFEADREVIARESGQGGP